MRVKKLLTAVLAVSLIASYGAVSFPASAAEVSEPFSVQLAENTEIEASGANLTFGDYEYSVLSKSTREVKRTFPFPIRLTVKQLPRLRIMLLKIVIL